MEILLKEQNNPDSIMMNLTRGSQCTAFVDPETDTSGEGF